MNEMELQQLRYFVAVAERRHFTRAALHLHVAQPSVSKQVRKLEDELGAILLERRKAGIALTDAGAILLPWARRVLSDIDGARSEVAGLATLERGRLSVGATPSLSTVLLPKALALYHAAHPGVALSVVEAGSRDLVRQLEAGDLDLALVILPVPREELFVTAPLLREDLVLAVSTTHPLAKRKVIRVSELRGVPLVMFREGYDLRSVTIAACEQAGFHPTFAIEGAEMDGVLRMAAAGIGVAVVPSIVVERGGPLVAVRLAQPTLSRSVGVAFRRDRHRSRAADAFVASLRAFVRDRDWRASLPARVAVS
ncbi:MAG TPA: LysR family transcriptional regulator [Candidatus Limnocylindria bacterium]|nr:LysR family transcriptional regulator [Candidatus Limnocylindria bacterium]